MAGRSRYSEGRRDSAFAAACLTIELQHGLAIGRGDAEGRDRNNEEGALHRATPALNDIAKLRRRALRPTPGLGKRKMKFWKGSVWNPTALERTTGVGSALLPR
jgi:hypothetical protein